MIYIAGEKDYSRLRQFWKECFPTQKLFIDDYLDRYGKESLILCYERNGKIVAAVSSREETFSFGEKLCQVGLIGIVAAQENCRNEKDEVLSKMLELHSRMYLISLMACTASERERYCFHLAYQQKRYEVIRGEFDIGNLKGMSEEVNPAELAEVYRDTCRYFTGYRKRSIADFADYIQQIENRRGKILGYYSSGKMTAYASFFYDDKKMVVEEIFFKDYLSLRQLLTGLLSYSERVIFYLADAFSLRNYSLQFHESQREYMSLRINDIHLLQKWCRQEFFTVADFYKYCRKPFMMRESI